MKHKTLMTTLLLSFMAAPLFVSCGEKEHNFATKWESDENYHWHVCMTRTLLKKKNMSGTVEKSQKSPPKLKQESWSTSVLLV